MRAFGSACDAAAGASQPRLILIEDGSPSSHTTIRHFGELRVFKVGRFDENTQSLHFEPERTIFAVNLDFLNHIPASVIHWLHAVVSAGGTLYLYGGKPGRSYSLRPFADSNCETVQFDAERYRISGDPIVPRVLRGEETRVDICAIGGRSTIGEIRALVVGRSADQEYPLVFAIDCGMGVILVDLASESVPSALGMPIVQRLLKPVSRAANLGALFAVEWASGRELEDPGCYNLILDDRPANYDYFNVRSLREWLTHMRSIAPDSHLDCGWTPDQTRPLGAYIDTLKRFDAGFVWHGFLHHIDHSMLVDPVRDLREGRDLMRSIAQRYRVGIQPVMIFPYERRNDELLSLLESYGFEAIAEYADYGPGDDTFKDDGTLPYHLCYSTPLRPVAASLPVMRRYPAPVLSRDMMLALSAIGLPLIAVAHPFNVGLRRVPLTWQTGRDSRCYMDTVLHFAMEKSLVALSLTEVSKRIKRLPQPSISVGEARGCFES